MLKQTTQMTTQSATLRQFQRYAEIDKVTIDSPLWLHITQAMLDRRSDTELKGLGSGQGSKMRMIEARVLDTFECGTVNGIAQRVDDNAVTPMFTIKREMIGEVVDFIDTLEF